MFPGLPLLGDLPGQNGTGGVSVRRQKPPDTEAAEMKTEGRINYEKIAFVSNNKQYCPADVTSATSAGHFLFYERERQCFIINTSRPSEEDMK